jgi:hypothetical protein
MVGREALNLSTWVRFLPPVPCACSLTVEQISYKDLIGVRFLVGVPGYSSEYVVDHSHHSRHHRSRPVHSGTEVAPIGV